MTTSKTADEIRGVMDALKLEVIATYFDQDDDELDPYVVCEGVSIAAFNEYVGDGEGLRIPLRFLALNDGRIVIVELPTKVHESTAFEFLSEFLAATGNRREVGKCGSMTARIAGNPNKEADTSFGPKRTTLNRTPAPRTPHRYRLGDTGCGGWKISDVGESGSSCSMVVRLQWNPVYSPAENQSSNAIRAL
ncbi:putative Uma2 domain-containing protein [Phytophthora infestans]|uniref:Putative Uma2 domain-containing protein n=1 Tax=Phytophthora infestans TaxID=4787 RepID=A0A8S9UQE3_PHYIN|nr:putative Uma2 domain-containing protein [Phytophthora infestans]